MAGNRERCMNKYKATLQESNRRPIKRLELTARYDNEIELRDNNDDL